MLSKITRFAVVLLMLSSTFYYSCRKDASLSPVTVHGVKITDPLALKAMEWYAQNGAMPKPQGDDDIDIKQYLPDWTKFSISKNFAGDKVITVPLIKKAGSKAFLAGLNR